MSTLNEVLLVVVVLVVCWLLAIVLPPHLRICWIIQNYGPVAKRRRQIEKLFLEGKLTYARFFVESDVSKTYFEFKLVLMGPFGTYIKRGAEDTLDVDVYRSFELPPLVAAAFDGYSDSASSVMYLLLYDPFLARLRGCEDKKFVIDAAEPESLTIKLCEA